MSKTLDKRTSQTKEDDFGNYRTGFHYSTASVLLSNDDDLSFQEKRSVERRTRMTCIIYAEKIKNLEKATEKRRITEEAVNNLPIDAQFPYKWYCSFTEGQLKELFKKYYTPGYENFCLAFMPENKDGLPLYKFTLPDHLIYYDPQHNSRTDANSGVDHYFEKLIDTIRGEYGNVCLSKGEFVAFIQEIRALVERVHLKNLIRKSDCLALNDLIKKLPDDKNISTDILNMMLNGMGEDFVKDKLVSKCQLCGDFFIFRENKKFCSPLTENKDCGKQARNKKYYIEKGQKNLPKYRKASQTLRAFYKEKGVKK